MMKERILESALDVYLKKPNATVFDVAEKAGISKSTIFYYFKNKNGLEKELLLYAIKKFTPWKGSNLEEAVKKRLRLVKDNPELARMFYTLINNLNKTDPEFVKDVCNKSFRKVSEILKKEGIKDEDKVTVLLLAMLDGLAMYNLFIDIDVTEFEDVVLKILRCMKEED
jgi:AcrR family transcriptional regulator